MSERHSHAGRCHCGAIEMTFETEIAATEMPLRACDCDFCRRHGVRAAADPAGRARIVARDAAALQRYRFGLGTADYLLCRVCGCYLGALMTEAGGAWATLNVNCLDDRAGFAAEAEPISYDREDETGRRARRRARWTPAELIVAETS